MNSENILTFADILNQENYLICDSCVGSHPRLGWYKNGVYEAKTFSGIDIGLVREEINELTSFIELLMHKGVYVTPGVVLELKRMDEVAGNSMRYLNSRERRNGNANGKSGREIEGRTALEEAQQMAHEAYRESRRAVFQPEQRSNYAFLEKAVIDITKEKRAKIDFGVLYEERKPREDHHTDEQIAAAALYLSSVVRTGCGILSRDSDIRRILVFALHDERLAGIYDMIQRNRIRIYSPIGLEKAVLDFDSGSGFILRRPNPNFNLLSQSSNQ